MKTFPRLRNAQLWGILILIGAILAGCRPVEQTPVPSPTTTVSIPTDTPLPQPSATPTSPPPLAILLAPTGVDAAQVEALSPVLEDQALRSGLRFEQRAGLAPADLQQDVRFVVSLPPAENLVELAAAAPQTRFIALGAQALPPANNLSVVQVHARTSDHLAFIAGYLAGAVAQDWRIGLLSFQGAPESAATRTAYANGLAFLCGLCRPVYPPFPIPGYPIVVELLDAADQAGWENAIAELNNWQVQAVYVTPQAASPALYQALAQAGFQIIGSEAPPEGTQAQWIASLGSPDIAPVVLRAWDELNSGASGQTYPVELSLSHINPELLSPGRQVWVEAVMADLAAGFIGTGAAATPAD